MAVRMVRVLSTFSFKVFNTIFGIFNTISLYEVFVLIKLFIFYLFNFLLAFLGLSTLQTVPFY